MYARYTKTIHAHLVDTPTIQKYQEWTQDLWDVEHRIGIIKPSIQNRLLDEGWNPKNMWTNMHSLSIHIDSCSNICDLSMSSHLSPNKKHTSPWDTPEWLRLVIEAKAPQVVEIYLPAVGLAAWKTPSFWWKFCHDKLWCSILGLYKVTWSLFGRTLFQ